MVAEHEEKEVAGVEGEAGEHAADFGVEGGEGFEEEGVGRLFGGGHGWGQGSILAGIRLALCLVLERSTYALLLLASGV